MTGSREASPDWLREFQAPTQSFVTLSSDSESSLDAKAERSDHTQQEEPDGHQKRTGKSRTVKPRTESDRQDSVLIDSGEDSEIIKGKKRKAPKTEKKHNLGEDAPDALEGELAEEDVNEKPVGPPVSSRLPLLFPDKVQRSKALVECIGDTIDLSGDVGAVGRVVVSNGPAGNHEMLLDLKGTIYKSTIVPSRTFCIVTVGQSEAKIEAIMNDFIQLEPQSNVFEAETMIEGTLDGFSFDSDEEGDKIPKSSDHQQDQNNENGDHANTKTKRKVDKSLDVVNKKAKVAGKAQKKGTRKPQTAKKTKKTKR